jgi:opacity protein-like surface antigen
MKKLTILLLFITTVAVAQESENQFHFGLKASPSLAWLSTDSKNVKNDGTKFGFTYGLITEFNFASRYAFATGIDVAYRGGKLKSTETTVSGDTTFTTTTSSNYTIQYIEVPITLKLKTNEIGQFTYFLQAGIAPGLNIRARANLDSNIQTSYPGTVTNVSGSLENEDVKDQINSLNVSMVIGAGLEYTLSGSTVFVTGIQFNNGFLDVFDTDEKINSNYLALTLAVLF